MSGTAFDTFTGKSAGNTTSALAISADVSYPAFRLTKYASATASSAATTVSNSLMVVVMLYAAK
jgi:hypothetical protein